MKRGRCDRRNDRKLGRSMSGRTREMDLTRKRFMVVFTEGNRVQK